MVSAHVVRFGAEDADFRGGWGRRWRAGWGRFVSKIISTARRDFHKITSPGYNPLPSLRLSGPFHRPKTVFSAYGKHTCQPYLYM